MTTTQERLVQLMEEGLRLFWFGDAGPELEDHPFWPQKRTVRALLQQGVLEWAPYANETQRKLGIRQLLLAPCERAVG